MATSFDLLKTKGALANFNKGMTTAPTFYRNYCTIVPATTKLETLAWPGMVPIPVVMEGSRQFQNLGDFELALRNQTFELSTIVPREALEDDQTGTLNQRLQEFGRAWETFKDSQLVTLLSDGDVSGNNAFDGTLFFSATRTIGKSANINNTQATAFVADFVPTAQEMLTSVQTAISTMMEFEDDQGRPGFATGAMTVLRLIVPPTHIRACREAVESTLLGGGDSNPYGNSLFQFDPTPYDMAGGAGDEHFICAVGENRKPFIYSERTPIEVIFRSSAEDIAENDGLMVLTRQRYVLALGEPRFIIQDTAI